MYHNFWSEKGSIMQEDFTSVLKEKRVFRPSRSFSRSSNVKSMQQFRKIYHDSIKNPEKFWAEKALQLDWFKKWDKVLAKRGDFYKWFVFPVLISSMNGAGYKSFTGSAFTADEDGGI